MRRRAARGKNQLIYPDPILLDHFETIDSVNEVNKKPLLEAPTYGGIMEGKFGLGLSGGHKTYDLSGKTMLFNPTDPFSIDFFYYLHYRGGIYSYITYFYFNETNASATPRIVLGNSSGNKLDISTQLFTYTEKSIQIRNIEVSKFYHIAFSTATIGRSSFINVYFEGNLVVSSEIPANYSFEAKQLKIQNSGLIDELFITQSDRSIHENNTSYFPVPTKPYSLE